jgi:hypothetical protein
VAILGVAVVAVALVAVEGAGVGEAPAAVASPLDLTRAGEVLQALVDPGLGPADRGGQLGHPGPTRAGGAQAGQQPG